MGPFPRMTARRRSQYFSICLPMRMTWGVKESETLIQLGLGGRPGHRYRLNVPKPTLKGQSGMRATEEEVPSRQRKS